MVSVLTVQAEYIFEAPLEYFIFDPGTASHMKKSEERGGKLIIDSFNGGKRLMFAIIDKDGTCLCTWPFAKGQIRKKTEAGPTHLKDDQWQKNSYFMTDYVDRNFFKVSQSYSTSHNDEFIVGDLFNLNANQDRNPSEPRIVFTINYSYNLWQKLTGIISRF